MRDGILRNFLYGKFNIFDIEEIIIHYYIRYLLAHFFISLWKNNL